MKEITIKITEETEELLHVFNFMHRKEKLNISDIVSSLIADGLRSKIGSKLGLTPTIAMTATSGFGRATSIRQTVVAPDANLYDDDNDVTQISEGLGDDALYDEAETDEMALLPQEGSKRQGVTIAGDSAMDKDMRVSNPGVEAKVEAPTFRRTQLEQAAADQDPEETFSQMAFGMQFPAEIREQDYEGELGRATVKQRTAIRKQLQSRTKGARVAPLNYDHSNSVEANL